MSSTERQQSREGFCGRERKQCAQNPPEGELLIHPFPVSFLCIVHVVVHSFSFYRCRRRDEVFARDALGPRSIEDRCVSSSSALST